MSAEADGIARTKCRDNGRMVLGLAEPQLMSIKDEEEEVRENRNRSRMAF